MPPSHYEEAVARAVERIRAGELEKIVLAREVEVHAPSPTIPAPCSGVLREAFPSCYVFAVGRGDATFVGASPELLVRREGQRASTVALAGLDRGAAPIRRSTSTSASSCSTATRTARRRDRRAADRRALRAALGVGTAAPEPALVRVANIQHLATPIRAQLARPVGAIELAGAAAPDARPSAGSPTALRRRLIPALEGLDRGWYAGPVGWTDADRRRRVLRRVAVRAAARARSRPATPGAAIVADSDPAAELAETEVKLEAMLPVLSG